MRRVPIGCASISALIEFDTTWAWALDHVSWVELMTSSSSGTRSSADRRVDAVRQNASSERLRRRSCSEVNLVGRVKSTARMRRRRCCVGASSGRRPSRAASTSAAIASALRTCPPVPLMPPPPSIALPASSSSSLPPASRTVTAEAATSTRTVRPRLPPVAAATTGMRSFTSSSRTAASLRWPTSRLAADTANMLAPPTRTASRRILRAPSCSSSDSISGTARSANLRGFSVSWPCDCGRTMWARPAIPILRSIRASPMHEPSPSETSTWPGARDTASSPIRTMVSAAAISSARAARGARRRRPGPAPAGRRSSSPRPRRPGSSRAAARRRP